MLQFYNFIGAELFVKAEILLQLSSHTAKQVGTAIEVNHSERVEAIAGHTHRSQANMTTTVC